MTAIQLLEKLGAQKKFSTAQLTAEELKDLSKLVEEQKQFMAIMTNEPAEEEPDEEQEDAPPAEEKIN